MGVALREILTEYKTAIPWESLAGTAAVDAHNALYQFLSIIRQPDGTPLMDSKGRVTSHLSGIFFRVLNFLEKRIQPVFVFDGEPPVFKQSTVEERREERRQAREKWQEALARGDTVEAYKQARSASRVDAFVIRSSRELLDRMGVPVVQAPSEGEAQAAFLAERGDARYAVSQDYDALLFGTPVLARNLTVSGKRKVRGRTVTINPEKIVLKEVLQGLGISREELIQIAILVGTDFNPGIHGIGPKTALKVVRKGEFESTLRVRDPDWDYTPILEFFLSPPVTESYTLSWGRPDPEAIRTMLCDEYEFSMDRVNSGLEKLSEGSGQKTLDSWF
jgi:flap endonuclease-1